MKIIADVSDRYARLKALEEEGQTVHEDGSALEAYREIAAELFDKHRNLVTFEERNHVIKIVKKALEASAFADVVKAAQTKAAGKPFPWSPV